MSGGALLVLYLSWMPDVVVLYELSVRCVFLHCGAGSSTSGFPSALENVFSSLLRCITVTIVHL